MSPLPFPVFPGLSATASLSLSADGVIPATSWALAAEHDAARAQARPDIARIRVVRPRLKPAAAAAIIASAIEKAALRGAALMRADLECLGLAPRDIDLNFAEGFRMAALRHPALIAMAAA